MPRMLPKLNLGYKALGLVCVPLIFQLILVGTIYYQMKETDAKMQSTKRSRVIILKVNSLLSNIFKMRVSNKYSAKIRTNSGSQKIFENTMAEIDALEDLCAGNEKDKQAVKAMRSAIRECVQQAYLSKSEKMTAQQRSDYLRPKYMKIIGFIVKVKESHMRLEAKGELLISKLRKQTEQILLGGTLVNIAITMVLLSIFHKGIIIRLEHLMNNTHRLASGDSLKPPIQGSDEIAHLDETFSTVANELLSSIARQKSIFQNVADVVCSIDAEGKFIQVSDSVIDTWDYSPEELEDMTLFDLVVADEVEATKEAFDAITTSGTKVEIETRIRTRNGPILNALWAISWAQEASEYVCVIHDITARKQEEELLVEAEDKLRRIIEKLPLGLVIANRHGIIESVNPVLENLLDYSKDELFDRPVSVLFQQRKDEELWNSINNSQGGTMELRALTKASEDFPVDVSSSIVETLEGDRVLITIVDITERHRIEQLKQQFVAMVSHELKTPITSVKNYFEFLEEGIYGTLTDKGSQRLPKVQKNLDRLMSLIKELIEVERLESRTMALVKSKFDLQDLFDLAIENVRPAAYENNISLDVEETQLEVVGDLDRLVQVLVNLCSNAIKFSPKDSTIQIKTKKIDAGLRISVSDEGRGIPSSKIDSVFQKYEQVESNDAREHGGLGLGLAICKEIVELHGGTIGVESICRKGSTFWFEIPFS